MQFHSCMCFFSKQVARMHGPAQLEYKASHHKKCGIYAVDSQSQCSGHGRGHQGGRGCGRSGHGGHGNANTSHMINGIDISDPTHLFTTQEWEALGHGHAIVMQLHESHA